MENEVKILLSMRMNNGVELSILKMYLHQLCQLWQSFKFRSQFLFHQGEFTLII